MQQEIDFSSSLPDNFSWLNPPAHFQVSSGLHITTDPGTDFWQRTHYGFRNDNGHALLGSFSGDFSIQTHVRFQPQNRYDQCGLLVRLDEQNWIKLSLEYETAELSMLGSVVTNLGYSDWATTEVDSAAQEMWYRISKNGADFFLQASSDGQAWQQLRITHLLAPFDAIQAGPYACSPRDGSFNCTFTSLVIADNQWKPKG